MSHLGHHSLLLKQVKEVLASAVEDPHPLTPATLQHCLAVVVAMTKRTVTTLPLALILVPLTRIPNHHPVVKKIKSLMVLILQLYLAVKAITRIMTQASVLILDPLVVIQSHLRGIPMVVLILQLCLVVPTG